MRSLNDLARAAGATLAAGNADGLTVSGLTADSRAVEPGMLFAALPGWKLDGRDYIAQAIDKGAVAVLAPEGTALPAGATSVALLVAAEPKRAFARMAGAFYGRQPEVVAAVTGTNGKTSTANFARQLWLHLGHAAASLGTLGVIGPDWTIDGKLTTPDPVQLHRLLAECADRGVTHLCMEASSHGLDQHRLAGVTVAAGGFTNLSRDHLDYHGTMESYLAAKTKLFGAQVGEGGAAVLNADIPEYAALRATAEQAGLRVVSYGANGDTLRVVATERTAHGQRLTLRVEGRDMVVELPLAGTFQAENALCALGLVIGCGADAAHAAPLLERLTGVPGRLQLAATRANGAAVYVDYAHTPDALETVLEALRPHAAGRLVCVFGAGGDRDRGKRPVMGEVVSRLADVAIVTDDNPRTEDPAFVRSEVMAGCPGGIEIGDRRAAIAEGVARLTGPGDVLLVAGKGHESGQTIGTLVHPFDDVEESQKAVARADGGAA
ncbi:UDP-N-acetylmuramoyl-L-alanyl-D-glutamate--2,6-diaminopimelate ligase [Caenispirillum bisanense]|uniref:UDP-N-acetylmuramoyl-L-alanyl-D-glutamate--2,6-diaminopimelate ligase n=1 Tax=Caenispirillum bisanense TaxID=414052 RepID=A0A286G4Y1_9PROT|nr:UDP-N-acetylmuramoyl-L-alanyl-D-glutamate--2,6-diaminopimelate ligase [Caenispirillum bisanense]SOD90558.1 UDP-N-acetylmuramoylalanyl-D-glutamate--2,6-diaminopimelate ligase [Caenispirillum bisanense]